MRIKETIVFDETIEVRSQPAWIKVLEFWFLWVHEFWSHTLPGRTGISIKLPTGNTDWWGDDGFEAAFHHFYTWTLNYDVRIESSVKRWEERK